ncbi:MAG: ABC transporter permease [bacterium]|nr:ABC transporter permease [bacterium]
MATATSTVLLPRPRRIRITRRGVYGVFFIVMALIAFAGAAGNAAAQTQLTFGAGLPTISVPTAAWGVFAGAVYALSAALAFIPVTVERGRTLVWIAAALLIVPTVLILAAAGGSTNVTVMLQVSLRLATPIVLGALAGIWAERSGVANIGIEGMMLTGACFGFVAHTLLLQSGWIAANSLPFGVVIAVIAGGLMAVLHAWLSITFKTDQIVSGTVINILALGVTSFIRREVLVSSEAGRGTLPTWDIPLLSDIPVLGDVFFSGKPIFYSMFVLLILTHVILFYTRWGLRTRAVGENPKAADTLGVNVIRNRWINVIVSGMIAGLAGAWFSLETTGSFDDGMTSGRGFIALAAMIFGKWMPFGAFGGGLLFGFSDALGQRFQLLGVPIPAQFLQMVPYVVTIIVLAGLVGRAVAPKADGVPYDKEGK